MSKKHNDQKLLIENFNKWINEEKCGEEEIDETAGHYMEAEPIEEDEEIDEAFFPAVMATGILVKKLGGTMMDLLKAYNDFTKVTREIASAPESEASPQVKDAAEAAVEAVPTLPQQIINSILQKKLGLDIDVGPIGVPTLGRKPKPEPESEPEPEPEPPAVEPESEPEDMETRAKLGLMSKDKQDRLKQLRDKYKSEPEEEESNEQ